MSSSRLVFLVNQALNDALFAQIKNSGTAKYFKTLRELNIDFHALESQIFSFDMPLAPFPLFNPRSPPERTLQLSIIAKKLMSVLITLGDAPFIRYSKTSPDSLAESLAKMVQKEIADARAGNEEYPHKNDFKQTILIIVDRRFDMISPLLHEFTYQAMFNDLIVAEKTKLAYTLLKRDPNLHITSPNYFVTLPAYTSLDENDTIWMLVRHWHFAEAVDYILESFTKFMHENKAASSAMNGPQLTGLDSLKAMKETLGALPQFQALKAKVSKFNSFRFILILLKNAKRTLKLGC